VTESGKKRWMGHTASLLGIRNAYKVLVWKREGNGLLDRRRCRWKSNIKLNLQEIKYEGVRLIDVLSDKVW
jgi:hypothetical protein